MVGKRIPLRPIFRVGNNQKSLGVTSGEYGGWVMTGMLFSAFAPSHTSLVVQQFLAEKSIPIITQPPYSPDLAPSDFWLFPALKMVLKGTRFATMEDIEWNATAEPQKIPKEAFRQCFQQWQDRWSKCVRAQGSYFEGD